MLLLDAEPSRKERGHRGVRPRHPNRQTFGSGNRPSGRLERVPQAMRDRVVLFVREARVTWRDVGYAEVENRRGACRVGS
jgi:hypothetical protein